MLVAESRMVMGKAHVFHVGSLSQKIIFLISWKLFVNAILIERKTALSYKHVREDKNGKAS